MCIALVSTAHPSYPLIVIDNRDEYLRRPTDPVDWWPAPNSDILGGRDLARATHGTWMGVTKSGKVAVLTNYRENNSDQITGQQSRGVIVNGWLTRPVGPIREYVEEMVASPEARSVGGFSLVCGYVNEPLAIVSNRSSTMDQINWIATEKGQTQGLSNTVFDDRSWPKILTGEKLVNETIDAHIKAGESEDVLIDRLLRVLSTSSLPELAADATAEDYLPHFRKSIFIPLIGTREKTAAKSDAPATAEGKTSEPSPCLGCSGPTTTAAVAAAAAKNGDVLDDSFLHGPYGTQKQTVLLVNSEGRVRYFERTLYDGDAKPVPVGQGDRSFEFHIQS